MRVGLIEVSTNKGVAVGTWEGVACGLKVGALTGY